MVSFVDIEYFKASEAYKSGSVSLGTDPRITQAEGLKRSYVGYQTEDASMLFWVNNWTTKGALDAFMNRADYDDIAAVCLPAFGSEPMMNQVEFEDADGALGAPITEFVTFTLKEGKTMVELEPLVQALHMGLQELKAEGTAGFYGDSWAPVVGKTNVYHGILGWETVDAHWKAVSSGPLKDVIDQVKLIANLWLVHAKLKGL